MLKKIKRLFLLPLVSLAAMVFLFEEFIWDTTARLMARLGKHAAVRAIEQRISALTSYWAIFAFLLPSSILVPAKLIGLHTISQGHWIFGSLIFAVAKIIGMALFSRIFNLTRPALLNILWFYHLYEWVMHYRNLLHAYLDNWPAYQRMKISLLTTFKNLRGKGYLMRLLRRMYKTKQI
jgi:hypothetical protein